jgi:hypothetical protein
MCGWGTNGSGEFFCPTHVTREQRQTGDAWFKEWNGAVVADMQARGGLFDARRSWRDTSGGRTAPPGTAPEPNG